MSEIPQQIDRITRLPFVRRQKDDHTKGYVYFLECGDFIKIGFSGSVERRVRGLQSSSPVPLVFLGQSYAHKRFERRLHKKFAHLRDHGEWFRKAPELLQIIRDLLP